MTPRNTICLWFDGGAVDAANFYASTFPDSSVGTVFRAPGEPVFYLAGDTIWCDDVANAISGEPQSEAAGKT